MDIDTHITLAKNVSRLMKHYGLSQDVLAKKAGVRQRMVSNLLNPGAGHSPTMSKVDSIARSLKVRTWQLMVPDIPLDVLLNRSIEKLIKNYSDADTDGRENITRIAENEVRYTVTKRTANGD